MSECVVRMEMPQGCGSCSIANFGYCSINNKQVGDPLMGYPENRPANCPIICQLPKEHGRLVDISPLDVMVFRDKDYSYCAGALSVCEQIDKLPTIVPAEAERSET